MLGNFYSNQEKFAFLTVIPLKICKQVFNVTFETTYFSVTPTYVYKSVNKSISIQIHKQQH